RLADAQRLGMPRLGFVEQVAPRAGGIDLARRGFQRGPALLHVLASQRLEADAVEVQQMLAAELVVHPALADRDRAAQLRFQIAVEKLLVLEEPHARASRGVLD